MGKHARLPADDAAPQGAAAEVHRIHRLQARYYAFLSYSHKDQAMADWLHRELERFRVPKSLAGRLTANGVIPARLTPIFRDRHELAAADDLGAEIRLALASSQYLVVLCSPDAAKSRWTNAEIEEFKRSRPEGCVLAAIVGGEPFASEMPGREAEECFPPALRQKFDRRGRPTGKRAEPLAADLRESADGRRMGFLKLVAGMLGVGLDELVQRETTRRQRRLAWVAAGSLAGMAVTSTLAVTAFQARDEARDQRREAEGLVGFMLDDLKEKLEPIGRLDALDAVGSRALGYFEKQDKSTLSDEALAQRSKALTMLGEIAHTRGDLDGALRQYREAFASTQELLQREPDNPQRLFDHAQNVFYLGYIDQQRGQLDRAGAAFREYRRLAQAMIALEPDNPKWKLELAYAVNGLGIILMGQHRYREAATAFRQGLDVSEALAASEPNNRDYQYRLLEGLAWLADANRSEGRLEDAIAHRERQLGLLERWSARRPDDRELSRKAMTAHRAISNLLASRGDMRAAFEHAGHAVQLADLLVQTEPGNTEWLEHVAVSKLDLGFLLQVAGDRARAASAIRSGCEIDTRLIAKDSSVRTWKEDIRLQCLEQRGRLALANNSPDEAVAIARQAVEVARGSKGATPAGAAAARAMAYNLLGDSLAAARQSRQATAAWRTAAGYWPKNVMLPPELLARGANIMRDAGNESAARQISDRLNSIGYRHPTFVKG